VGIHQNTKEKLKLKSTPSTLIKYIKRQRKLNKKIFIYKFISNMRLKYLSTTVIRDLWYSGGHERPRVSWKQKNFF